jgi:hypothetical protein
MKLIGLTGAIGSGKTTVASILCQNHSYIELTFKGAMVACLAHVFGCDKDIFYDRELKELPNSFLFGKSPREVMQTFGTDWGRKQVHNDIWVKRVELMIATANEFDPNRCFVVSDVRFENEVQMIKRLGGRIWKIERIDNPFAIDTSHESEQGFHLSLIDKIVENPNNMPDLEELINLVLANEVHKISGEGFPMQGYYGA